MEMLRGGFAVDEEEPGGNKCGKRSWGKLVLAGFDSTLLSLGPVVGMYQVPSPPLTKNMAKEVA